MLEIGLQYLYIVRPQPNLRRRRTIDVSAKYISNYDFMITTKMCHSFPIVDIQYSINEGMLRHLSKYRVCLIH